MKQLENENSRLRTSHYEKLRKEYYHILTQKFNYWFGSKMLPKYIAGDASKITATDIKKVIDKFNKDFFSTTNPTLLSELLKYLFSSKEAIEITNKEFFYTKLNEYELKNMGTLIADENIAAESISKG